MKKKGGLINSHIISKLFLEIKIYSYDNFLFIYSKCNILGLHRGQEKEREGGIPREQGKVSGRKGHGWIIKWLKWAAEAPEAPEAPSLFHIICIYMI